MADTLGLATAGGLLALVLATTGADAASLTPHRAVYDMVMDGANPMSDTSTAMKGRMVYEFTGSACQGYTVNFRFVLETRPDDGDPSTTDMRTTNFESADNKEFRFTSQTFTNQVLTEDVAGEAKRGDDALAVTITKPDGDHLTLPVGSVFPSDHLLRIIAAGEAGERILTLDTYDGSDGGRHLYKTTVVIGAEITEPLTHDEEAIGTSRRWPVVVSYFDAGKSGDLTPDYAVSFNLWDNGVSTRMRLDYGDFALKGDLSHFEALAAEPCPAATDTPAADTPATPTPP
jgi:hypothetical protein